MEVKSEVLGYFITGNNFAPLIETFSHTSMFASAYFIFKISYKIARFCVF